MKARLGYFRLFVYGIIPVFIWCMPPGFLDETSFCFLYNVFHIKCITCGMTRAFVHLLHLDFEGAFSFNPLVAVVFPLICILVMLDIIRIVRDLIKKSA